MEESVELPIQVHLQISHVPPVFDLSGSHHFEVSYEIKRSHTDNEDSRPLTLLTTGSLFDVPHAFENGLLELVDQEDREPIKINITRDHPPRQRISRTSFISLLSRASAPNGRSYDHTIPLKLQDHLQAVLLPGHKYRVQTACHDLGIKWWRYGSLDDFCPSETVDLDSLPPSEPGTLVAARSTIFKSFPVVDSIPTPPRISISLSLSSDTVHRSGTHPTNLKLLITNRGERTVTVKSTGEQPYIKPFSNTDSGYYENHITSLHAPPSVKNFSIINTSTGEELISSNVSVPSHPGSSSWSRNALTTLEPGVAVAQDINFLHMLRERTGDNEEQFWLRLREASAWWCCGTVEEMFRGEEILRILPGGPTLPLKLESEDEVMFKVVD